jgi:hypothetical protein
MDIQASFEIGIFLRELIFHHLFLYTASQPCMLIHPPEIW